MNKNVQQIAQDIDLAYCIGVLNTSGIDGLHKELNRLKTIKKNPHEMFGDLINRHEKNELLDKLFKELADKAYDPNHYYHYKEANQVIRAFFDIRAFFELHNLDAPGNDMFIFSDIVGFSKWLLEANNISNETRYLYSECKDDFFDDNNNRYTWVDMYKMYQKSLTI